jgi:hypothetical protein
MEESVTYRDEQGRVWEPEIQRTSFWEMFTIVFAGGMAITTGIVCLFM